MFLETMNILSKIVSFVKHNQYHIFLAICIGLISFISFNLGKIASNEKGSIKITNDANIYQASKRQETSDQAKNTPTATPKPLDMRVVVSKASDSKKYHHTWCGSWKRITAKNQLWFENEEAAIKAGYTLAGNCSR